MTRYPEKNARALSVYRDRRSRGACGYCGRPSATHRCIACATKKNAREVARYTREHAIYRTLQHELPMKWNGVRSAALTWMAAQRWCA